MSNNILEVMFKNNAAWVANMIAEDPDFFARLAKQQKPELLWIGCSDSRVPANQISGLLPGEVFVHRNIANVVSPTDTNCLAVVEYAVTVLKVKHIIVCGHYQCGGVQAALSGGLSGHVGAWLDDLREVYERHRDDLSGLPETAALNRLCEINVAHQLTRLCRTDLLRDAWQQGLTFSVHGWIYSIEDGLLKDLDLTVSSAEEASRL